jgi:hypothetical protein
MSVDRTTPRGDSGRHVNTPNVVHEFEPELGSRKNLDRVMICAERSYIVSV